MCGIFRPGTSGDPLGIIQIITSAVTFLVEYNTFKIAAFIERYTAVEEQISIKNAVHAAFLIEKIHMLTQTDTADKCHAKPFHYLLFFGGQFVRNFQVGRIKGNRRKSFFADLVVCASDADGVILNVDLVEQQFVSHLIIRVSKNHLPFQFE